MLDVHAGLLGGERRQRFGQLFFGGDLGGDRLDVGLVLPLLIDVVLRAFHRVVGHLANGVDETRLVEPEAGIEAHAEVHFLAEGSFISHSSRNVPKQRSVDP